MVDASMFVNARMYIYIHRINLFLSEVSNIWNIDLSFKLSLI